MHQVLYRPIIIISFMLGILVMAELLALGSITWRNLHRIDKIKEDIIQGHELEELVIKLITSPKVVDSERYTITPESSDIHKKLTHFFANQPNLDKDKKLLLDEIKPLLLNIEQGKDQDITPILLIAQKIFNLQDNNEERLLTQVYKDSNLELNFAVFIPIVVLLPVFLLALVFFRRRILSPLNALEYLLKRLIDGEMQPIVNRNDQLMQPLFDSYNRLIRRLQELEAEHVSYTQTLEREIRHATHALLEQSRTLARSERLAAVGELAASAAHELRNPLAGIQAALENMCSEFDGQEIAQRLHLVNAEIKRLTLRLNDLLANSKQQPEAAKMINIPKLVGELLTLLKYQVNENVRLIYSIPPQLESVLPETEFRQALLNLLLNSIQELGKQGGTINLSISKQRNNINIEVSDTGQGFPSLLLEGGVRPFASYHEHGTGLGLSMVLRFARSLGGQLKLKNDNQGHACATLTLPVNA